MTSIDLGHRTSFRLGHVQVHPSSCEITSQIDRVRVEPRVMQVLVALAEAGGATVTRDDLIRLCWDGRVVGEDSINRVILKVRQLARDIGRGSFELQTIKKVGYRLRQSECSDVPGVSPIVPGREPGRPPRRLRPYATAAALAVLGLAGLKTMSGDASSRVQAAPAPGAKALQPAALDLAMRGAAASFEQTASQQPQAIRYFRAALEQSPDDPSLWGALALNYVLVLPYTPPKDQRAVLVRVDQAARRSLALNPGEGHALAASAYLQPTYGNWVAKERLFRQAIAQSDQGSPAPTIHYSRFLASVGRITDALRYAEEAMRIHPLVPWLNVNSIQLLQADGRLEDAERVAERAARLWPRNHDLWHTRFFLLVFNGSPDVALAMAEDHGTWPEGVRESDMLLLQRLARAVRSGSQTAADAVLSDLVRLAGEGQTYAEQAMLVAQRLERPEQALRVAEQLYLSDNPPAVSKHFRDHDEFSRVGERPTAVLFLNRPEQMAADPRFLALADRIGLTAFWRQNGAPDFCRSPAAQAQCSRRGLKPQSLQLVSAGGKGRPARPALQPGSDS